MKKDNERIVLESMIAQTKIYIIQEIVMAVAHAEVLKILRKELEKYKNESK